MTNFWNVTGIDGQEVGRISSACRAYSYDCNAAIGLISNTHWDAGTELIVHASDGQRSAYVEPRFWGRHEKND